MDSTFGTGGKQTTDFGLGPNVAQAAAVQPDGKIVLAGVAGQDAGVGDFEWFALSRYNPNGTLDTSFGDGGKVISAPAETGWPRAVSDIALQPDGKIVAVGGSSIVRYNENGSLDTSFSDDGVQTLPTGGGGGVALQNDGKIVAVTPGGGGTLTTARYNADGSFDSTFSGDGKQTADFGDTFAFGLYADVALQADGRIVVVGTTENAAGGEK